MMVANCIVRVVIEVLACVIAKAGIVRVVVCLDALKTEDVRLMLMAGKLVMCLRSLSRRKPRGFIVFLASSRSAPYRVSVKFDHTSRWQLSGVCALIV